MPIELEGYGGVPLVADVQGRWNGPPVLLLHGEGGNRHVWDSAASLLAERGFLAVTLDSRGHGDSGGSAGGDYAIDLHLADLCLVADQLGGKVGLVGTSCGGLTALLAAAEQAAVACTELVLVDSALSPETLDRISSRPHQRQSRRFRDELVSIGDAGATVTARLQWAAGAVGAPMLVVRSSGGGVSDQDTEAFLDLAPQAEYVKSAGPAGHGDEALTQQVVQFLVRTHGTDPAT